MAALKSLSLVAGGNQPGDARLSVGQGATTSPAPPLVTSVQANALLVRQAARS